MKFCGKLTKYRINEDGIIYNIFAREVPLSNRNESAAMVRLYINGISKILRIDRLMYENFFNGNYYDDIPIIHLNDNEFDNSLSNLHVGFLNKFDDKYELWKKYIYKYTDFSGNIHEIETKYWISTIGRCYGCAYWKFMKPHENMYPIRPFSDNVIEWIPIKHMVASTFIPNINSAPYVVLIDGNSPISVDNLKWSFSEDSIISEASELPEDMRLLFSGNSQLDTNIWREIHVDGVKTNYIVSRYGNIFNTSKKHLMSYHHNTSGYPTVKISNIPKEGGGEKSLNMLVHRIIAQAFIPNPENKPDINHIDGNKDNYSIDNLEWVTVSENNKHARDTGLVKIKYDDEHHMSKLSSSVVESIIIKYLNGIEPSDISKELNIGKPTISAILRGIRYKRIGKKYGLSGKTRRMRFIDEYKPKIFDLLEKGYRSTKEITEILGIDYMKNRAFVGNVKTRYLNNTLII